MELADDAPTLHVYVRDVGQQCTHRGWRDPGAEEWADVMTQLAGPAIVTEMDSTTLILPGQAAVTDPSGSLLIRPVDSLEG